jgi:integral membrane protein
MSTHDAVPTAPALSGPARAFKAVAIAEACSWAGLLVGMFFKYVAVGNEIGVKVFGPIHGALFVAYLVITVVAARRLRWDVRTLLLALVASVPPLFTLWFERWAERTGRLTDPQPSTAGASPSAR